MYEQAKTKRFAIVASRFNKEIVDNLVAGAQRIFTRYEVGQVAEFWVPGAFEIPLMAKSLAESGHFDALICVGAVIRGETTHFEHVSAQAAAGILQSSLQSKIPIIFSLLTTENIEQAKARARENGKNEGARGALAAIEMVHQLHKVTTLGKSLK